MFKKPNPVHLLIPGLLCSLLNPAVSAIITEADLELTNPVSLPFAGTAYNLDPYFSTEYNADIGDASGANISEVSTHVSIIATGDGSFDYFSFTVFSDGLTGIFDIDYGYNYNSGGSVDTELALWDSTGAVLVANDDSSFVSGAAGSVYGFDSFIQYNFSTAGTYFIGVAKYNSAADANGWSGNVLDTGETYTLQVALGTGFSAIVPVPPALYLFMSGVLSLVGYSRATKKHS